ncbi:MAG: hypothetical protein Q8922_11990, partial [Bacteroidota bacterium]|nr:hypothetical protein [Bacteroidota bacterium]
MRTRVFACLAIVGCAFWAQPADGQWKRIGSFKDSVTQREEQINCVYFLDLPGPPRIGFACADDLWKTTDGGNSWFRLSSKNEPYFAYDIVFKDTLLGWAVSQAIGTHYLCFQTTDGGYSWKPLYTPISGDPDPFAVYYSDFSNRLFLGLVDSVMLVSNDQGDTWERTPIKCAVAFAFTSPANGIVVTNPIVYLPTSGTPTVIDSLSHVFVTSDGGVTWRMGHQPFNRYANGYAFQPLAIPGTSTYFEVEGHDGFRVWRSDDSGMNWSLIAAPNDSAVVLPIIRGTLKHLYLQTMDSGMYKSTDEGITWHREGGPSWPANGLSRFYSNKTVTIASRAYDSSAYGPFFDGLWEKIDPESSVKESPGPPSTNLSVSLACGTLTVSSS